MIVNATVKVQFIQLLRKKSDQVVVQVTFDTLLNSSSSQSKKTDAMMKISNMMFDTSSQVIY